MMTDPTKDCTIIDPNVATCDRPQNRLNGKGMLKEIQQYHIAWKRLGDHFDVGIYPSNACLD